VSAHDPGATLLSILLLAAAALVAAAVPAWRAVRIDPRIALIAE
jgi:ABC-type antimicrobial peptide transport system permease subunit